MKSRGTDRAHRVLLLVGVILTAVVLAGLALVIVDATDEPEAPEIFDVGGVLRSVAVTEDAVWIARGDRTLVEIDPRTAVVRNELELGVAAGDMVALDGSLWVGAVEGESILRVDPSTAEVVDEIRVGVAPQSLAAADGDLLVAAFDDGVVRRIDPDRGRVIGTVFGGKEAFPSSVVSAFGEVWVADVVDDVVVRLPDERIPVGDSPTQITAGGGYVWTANFNDRSVTRIDPDTAAPSRAILVGGKPGGISVAGDTVWVLRPATDSVVRVEAAAGRWDGEVTPVGDAPQDVAVGHGYVWIVCQDGSVARIPLAS